MIEKYEKAGKLCSEIRGEAVELIKDGLPIIDLVEFVEGETLKRGGGIAFPCNVSVNEIAAHYTSPLGDTNCLHAGDLVKLDLGVHIDGFISDSAITVMVPGDDLESRVGEDYLDVNYDLIDASRAGLDAALSTVRAGVELGAIGSAVEEAIRGAGFNPIANLAGHQLDEYVLHSGVSVPNVGDKNTHTVEEGDVLAIEPFATTGDGMVTDTPQVYIYKFMRKRPFRMVHTKRVLNNVIREYPYLPFSKRWLCGDFEEHRLNTSLLQLSQAMAIYAYPALRERTGEWVSQAEHTVIVESDGCKIISE